MKFLTSTIIINHDEYLPFDFILPSYSVLLLKCRYPCFLPNDDCFWRKKNESTFMKCYDFSIYSIYFLTFDYHRRSSTDKIRFHIIWKHRLDNLWSSMIIAHQYMNAIMSLFLCFLIDVIWTGSNEYFDLHVLEWTIIQD